MQQRIKGTRESNADRAAGPSALRLDQLPAEVRAEERTPCLLTLGPRRSVRREIASPLTCAARPLQVLQACAVHLAQNCWIEPQALTEAFLLPTVCRRAPHLSHTKQLQACRRHA